MHQGRELHKAHAAHKVHMKGWTQRIAAITDPRNHATTFTQDRIIHGHGESFPCSQALLRPSADLTKELAQHEVLGDPALRAGLLSLSPSGATLHRANP